MSCSGFAGLRIGLVGPLPPPAGGMANQTQQLAELLRSAGAEVSLVQTNAPYRPAWIGTWRVLRALPRLLIYLRSLWTLTGRCDLIHLMANSGWSWHLFATPAIWIGRCREVPVVVNYRGGEAGTFLASSVRMVGWSLRRASCLVVPSGYLQAVFADHGVAAQVVSNIIDLARFHPPESPRIGGAHLVVARNLEPIYDNATALHVLEAVRQRVPNATLTVTGTGPNEGDLRALAEHLGLSAAVHFSGRLDRDAMAALYRRADVLLNTSLVDNMPNSLLEALASGVPIVSTNVGGVPFVVKHGTTALLVPPSEPAEMAAAVLQLLENPSEAARLRAAGLQEVRQYTWSAVAQQLASVYRAALGKRRPA